jgi:class 3 adenylate cyclase/tetratricopeptide (TPR) repeat protein
MRCSKCGSDNSSWKKFCGDCGARLANSCPKCGAENPEDKKFCGDCGASLLLTGGAASATQMKADVGAPTFTLTREAEAEVIPDGERKTVTALFADIRGSTELEQELDPEEARIIVDPALKLMIDAVNLYDGYIVQSTGDGVFALFGAPAAHEDHPQRALYAALRMQVEMRRYSAKLVADGGKPLQSRIGINTGEVVVRSISTGKGHSEYTPIGHTTNLASRMQAVAGVGSIAVAESTRKMCEGYFVLKSLGPTRVKGVAEPVNVYEVTGLGPLRTRLQRAVGRGLTKFVGRHREMEALKHALEQARTGRGQILAAMAEPGVGKSRLFFEFKAVSQSGCMVLEAFSVSHGKASAYLPVIDLLHGYFKITGEDDPRTRREKVTGRVGALDRALEDTLPYLFALLGVVEGEDPLAQMDGQIKKRRTLEAIKRILLRESLNQPLMVIFEDLHWIDEQTQEFLKLLADSIGTSKIFLLVNYRPEYSDQWNSKTYYTQLRLDPLGRESAAEMLSALLGDNEGLNALKRLIIEKSEGTPFFMEETVQVLFEEGTLVRNGATHLTRPLEQLKIPPTVQAILASRIDRLSSDEKDLLHSLAVVGREFPLSLIRAVVTKSDDELNRLLSDLQLGEFIYEQPAVGDTEYIFKHALTQEVAYNSVLMERRKQLHERIGAALEALYASSLEDHLVELAHHYSRSPNADKAVDYLGRAAQQALSRSAFNEAFADARAGVGLIAALAASAERSRRESGLLFTLVLAASGIEGFGSQQGAAGYRRILELAQEWRGEEALFTALLGMWMDSTVGARHQEAAELVRQMLTLAEHRNSPAALADAQHCQGATLSFTGHYGEALTAVNRAITLCPDGAGRINFGGVDPLVMSLNVAAVCAWVAGYPDRAINFVESAIKRSRDLNLPFSIINALSYAITIRAGRGEVLQTQHLCEQVEALADERGFVWHIAATRICHGWVASTRGEHERAIALIRSGIADWKTPALFAFHSLTLAEACLRAGRHQEAMDAVAAGREHAARTGEIGADAEFERLAGEASVLIDAENTIENEQCFRYAIAIAAEQRAKSFELRATTSLARLLRDNGRREEARAILAETYGWFEGFDTADLKEAKALLEELSD